MCITLPIYDSPRAPNIPYPLIPHTHTTPTYFPTHRRWADEITPDDLARSRRPALGQRSTTAPPCKRRLADEEGLALPITPDDLARSRRPALGGAGLTKKVLLCPSRPTILHDHAARHLADEAQPRRPARGDWLTPITPDDLARSRRPALG